MVRKYFGTDGIRGKANEGAMTAETALRLAIFAAPAGHAPVAAVSAWVAARTAPDHGRALGSYPTHRAGAVLANRPNLLKYAPFYFSDGLHNRPSEPYRNSHVA